MHAFATDASVKKPAAKSGKAAASVHIECPPCTLRGSTLPVSESGIAAAQPTTAFCQPTAEQRSQTTRGRVRQNRASRLRRQRSGQLNFVTQEAADDGAIVSTNSSSSSKEEGNNNVADSVNDQDGSGASVGDDNTAAATQDPTRENYSISSSIASSVLQPSDRFDSNLNDLLLQSIEITRASKPESPDIQSIAEDHKDTSPTIIRLNVTRLNEQLIETNKQRQQLKDNIASLAKMVSLTRHSEPVRGPATAASATAAAAAAAPTVQHANTNDSTDSTGAVSQRTKDAAKTEDPSYPSDTTTTSSTAAAARVLEYREVPPIRGPQSTSTSTTPTAQADTGTQQLGGVLLDETTHLAAALRLKEAAKECAELRLSRESLRRELEVAKFDLRIASADAQERRVELTQLRRELQMREKHIEQVSADRVRTEKEVENLRSQLLEMRRKLDSAEINLQAESAKNLRFKAHQASLEAQLEGRLSELTSVTNALIEKRRSEDELLARTQQMQRALANSEETVKQLTEQLTVEQAKIRETLRQAERSRRPLSPQLPTLPEQYTKESLVKDISSELTSTPERSTFAVVTADARLTPSESQASQPVMEVVVGSTASPGTLEQRMAELDARIGRLVAEARDRGWRRDGEQQQQQLSQLTHDGAAVTSTPRSPTSAPPSSVSDPSSLEDDGIVGSLKLRTARLETSNWQLVQDVQSLRRVCTELLQSRQQLKRQVSQSQAAGLLPNNAVEGVEQRLPQPTAVTHQPEAALSNYLFATETLGAMINRQITDLQNSSRRKRRPDPLSGELRSQHEAVNQCWQTVQHNFLATETQAPDPAAYREFYLKRRNRYHPAAKSLPHPPAVSSGTQCTCRHSRDCPMRASQNRECRYLPSGGRLEK